MEHVNVSRWTVALWLSVVAFAACDVETAREPSATPMRSLGSTSASPSDAPDSDVDVQTFSIAGSDELLERLGDLGWSEALILPGAEPRRLQVWGGDGHWHSRTSFRSHGMDVTLVQAGFEGLPPGQLTTIRGEDGVRSDGGLYWIEREFTFAISPANKVLARSLRWAALP
jgi:hypothetical protein